MPADQAGQGEQAANANASTPTPLSGADKPTTTDRVKEPSSHAAKDEASKEAVSISALDARLEIPSEILEQLPKLEPEEQAVDTPLIGASTTPEGEEPESPTETTPEAKETKPKTEDEDEDEAEAEDELTPAEEGEKPDKRQKRINRLTRQKRELEDKLDTAVSEAEKLKEQLETPQKNEATIPGSGRLAHISTEQELSQEVSKAESVIEWCDEHPDGATTDGDKFISPEEVAKWKRNSEKTLLMAPNRRDEIRAFNLAKTHFDNLAGQAWPELFDKGAKAYQLKQSILKQFPSVKSSPEANYAVGLVIEGMRAVQARVNPNGNGSDKPRHDISPRAFEPRVPIAPHTPEPPSREVTPSSTKRYNEAMSNLKNDPDGSAASLAAVFAAEDEMSRTRAGSKTPVKV